MGTVPWDEIPDLALQYILEYADLRSQKNALLVSKRWNKNQSMAGLVVNIDDRREGIEDFLEKSLIKEAIINFLGSQESVLDSLSRARALTFCNYVNPSIFEEFLHGRTWNNLSKLFFAGSSLITQDLRSPNDGGQVVPVTFLHLKVLDVRISSDMIQHARTRFESQRNQRMRDVISVRPVGYRTWYSYPPNMDLEGRARSNVRYLLQSIRSLVLTSFHISATSFFEKNPDGESESSINDFLKVHATTLQKLIIQNHYGDSVDLKGNILLGPLDFPIRGLKSLFLCQIPEQVRQNVVDDLICAQDKLEDLDLVFEKLPLGDQTARFLTNLIVKNSETLTYLSLSGLYQRDTNNSNRELDLRILRSCPKLKTLKLETAKNSYGIEVKNLNQLPSSLEVYQAGYSVETTADFNGAAFIKKMRNLELLKIPYSERHGTKEDLSEFIRAALRHRRLCCLDFVVTSPCRFDQGSRPLFNSLLAEVFRPDNEVEFQNFYVGIKECGTGNYRHYFDVVPGPEQIQPFNMDHGMAKSYSVTKFLNPGLTQADVGHNSRYRSRLCSLAASTMTAFDLDAQVNVGSGVWLCSDFYVQNPDKAKRLNKIYKREKRDNVGGDSDSDSDSEFVPMLLQGFEWSWNKIGLRVSMPMPAIEVNQYFQVREIKKLN